MGTAVVGYVADAGNVLVDSLVWGARWVSEGDGPTVITVAHASGARPAEIAAMRAAMAQIEAVANVRFEWLGANDHRDADITFIMRDAGSAGLLGQGYPPGEFWLEPLWNPGLTQVNIYRNAFSGAVRPGSVDYITFLHEFGHAMGLAHPHDRGGTWLDKSLVFPGVTPGEGFGDTGTFDLNQGIFTVMSYNDGWHTGSSASLEASYMALDILAFQAIYGANTTFATGNDVYSLSRTHAGFTCIWDADGNDTIKMAGRGSCLIDLRAATGQVEGGGGGFVSLVGGGRGGFTIAAGVTIENATGGAWADTLIGNDADNRLQGGRGRDTLKGGDGHDSFVFLSVRDTGPTAALADEIVDFMSGEDVIDLSGMDAARSRGQQHFAAFSDPHARFSAPGQVSWEIVENRTFIYLNTDRDAAAEGVIVLDGAHALTDSDFLF